MGVLDVIKARRSIRDFIDREISEDAMSRLIDAAVWAPSAGNLQSRKFYFVLNQEIKKRLAAAALNQGFVARAPLAVVACMDRRIAQRYGDRGVNLYAIQDVSASIINMMLVAHEMGLGSCWVGAFDEFEVIEILDLPDNLRPVAIIPLGYPAHIPKPPRRVSIQDAVEFIR